MERGHEQIPVLCNDGVCSNAKKSLVYLIIAVSVGQVSKLQDCLPASQRAIEGELINPTSETAKPKKGLWKFLSAMVKGNWAVV